MADDNQSGQGRGNFGNEEQHREAGHKGGEATAQTQGEEFYSEIGRKGGQSQGKENNPGNFANDPGKASEAGRKGGSK